MFRAVLQTSKYKHMKASSGFLIHLSSGSVGQLDPNCECMLLDDDGNEVADGQPGELYVRGPNICLGYWRNPQATKESISPDGWLKSGDVAVVKNGWFWIGKCPHLLHAQLR